MNVEHIPVHLALELVKVSVGGHGHALVVAEVGLLVPSADAVLGSDDQVVVLADHAHLGGGQVIIT